MFASFKQYFHESSEAMLETNTQIVVSVLKLTRWMVNCIVKRLMFVCNCLHVPNEVMCSCFLTK